MARYFQAPNLQPLNYGPDMPFQEVMAVLQDKQKKFDTNAAELVKMNQEKIKSLEKDYPLMQQLMAENFANVRNIMYDEKGNFRDLSSAKPLIDAEAQRRAQLKSHGGQWWALEKSYDNWTEHVKMVDEQLKSKNITEEQATWLKTEGLNNYQGIKKLGDNLYGNLFTGKDAVATQDAFKYGMELAKGWNSTKFQSAIDFTGKLDPKAITEENLNLLREKHGQTFKSLWNGAYLQDGTLEVIYFDEVYNHVFTGLLRNREQVNYARRQAEMRGITDPKEQEQFITALLQEAAIAAAEKESAVKFSPNIRENWQMRVQREHSNRMAQIEEEKRQEQVALEYDMGTNTYQRDGGDFAKDIENADNLVSTLKGEVSALEAIPKAVLDANPGMKEELESKRAQLNQAIENQSLMKGAVTEVLKDDDYAKKTFLETFRMNTTGGNSSDPSISIISILGKDKFMRATQLRNSVVNKLKTLNPSEIEQMISSGKFHSSIAKEMEELQHLQSEAGPLYAKQFGKDTRNKELNYSQMLRSAQSALSTNRAEALKGYQVEFKEHMVGSKATGTGANNNFLEQRRVAMEEKWKAGATSFLVQLGTAQKQMSINDWTAFVKQQSNVPSDAVLVGTQLTMSGAADWNEAYHGADNVVMTATFKDKAGKIYTMTNKASVPVEFMDNDNAYTIEQSVRQAQSAVRNADTSPFAKEQLNQASHHMGRALYGKSYSENYHYLKGSDTRAKIFLKNSQTNTPEWVIERNQNTYSIRAAQYDPSSKQYIPGAYLPDPNSGDKIIFDNPKSAVAALGAWNLNLQVQKNSANPDYKIDFVGIGQSANTGPTTSVKVKKK